MSKPDWCPQEVWDVAVCLTKFALAGHTFEPTENVELEEASVAAEIARAIMAAKAKEREAIQVLLGHGAPHSPRRYIYDNTVDRRIWACDQLDEAIRKRGTP